MQYSGIASLKPLSRSFDHLEANYDVIVVGSGYGGSIAASRLARAGRRVAILERGREVLPGHFPQTPEEARPHIQLIGRQHRLGDARGLYCFHIDGDVNVLGGCGLGGGSLINAGVALKPDPRVFEEPVWPAALRQDRSGLDEGFAKAQEMLRPTTYPASLPPLRKVEALRAETGSGTFSYTPVNVSFRSGPSPAGIDQVGCNGCGDCITGCNVGAKNTLLVNYLPDAAAHGAQIFTEVDVRWVEPNDAGWVVMVRPLHSGQQRFHADPLPVRAAMVVLAAGALGSTGILLRSAARGLAVSDRLGESFSGNGDVLGYSLFGRRLVGAVGSGHRLPDDSRAPGPCISGVLDDRSDVPVADGIVVEDAVIPGAIAGLVPELLLPEMLGAWFDRSTRGSGPLAWLGSAVTRGRYGLLQRLQTFLVMGHDGAGGRIALGSNDEPFVDWPGAGTGAYYRSANTRLSILSRRSGGRFLPDPVWTKPLHHKLVTVHPLGGCPMADDADRGVVDDRGRVFAGTRGPSVHDGLYVWDGSVIPTSLGVNPLFTISALTERAASLVAAEKGWTINCSHPGEPAPGGTPDEPARSPAPSLTFTERMSGWWDPEASAEPADEEDYVAAAQRGEAANQALSFVLTVTAADAERAVADTAYPMEATGTVRAPALSSEPLLVVGGRFRLFVRDEGFEPDLSHMHYDLPLQAVDGRLYHLRGYKTVRPGAVRDTWPDTSTLYATLRRESPTGQIVGAGILRIRPADFARQLTTMAVAGPLHAADRLTLLARFGRAFAGALWDDYGTVVHHSVAAIRPAQPRRHRPLDLPPRQVVPYSTADGLTLRLTRYRGGGRGPVVLVHGMGANPLTYLLDTVSPNMVEYLVGHGFDVWLQEWRGSTMLDTCRSDFDADQVAHLDHAAAELTVKAETGRSDVHWVTHCVGSMTWMMATLAGVVRPASLFCSQVAAHPIGPRLTRIKVGIRAPDILRAAGLRLLTTDSFEGEGRRSAMFDRILRLYPVPGEEQCQHAVCRRLAFIYGVAAHRAALDDATHAYLHELFGPTNMRMMGHLARCARAQRLVAGDGADLYMDQAARLRLPVTMIHGTHNLVWLPDSTATTQEWFNSAVGSLYCRRQLIPDHGHQDCFVGATAWRDVFPTVLAHLEWAGA